jgi:Flp pilus assembly protein TadD
MAAVSGQRSDFRAARKNYEEALSHCPDFIPTKRRLAILSAANPGDNQQADDLATKAREAFPDDPELVEALGIIVFRQGDFARAASLLKECSSRSSDDAGLMYCLGMAQRRLQQSAESGESLQRALALNLRGNLAEVARRILAERQGGSTFWIANGKARP